MSVPDVCVCEQNAGVKIDPSAQTAFDELKSGRKHHFVLFKISDDKKFVVVDESCNAEQKFDYNDFKKKVVALNAKGKMNPRYIVLNYAYQAEENRFNEKIIFIAFIPDNAAVQEKMLYASCVETVKKSFVGIAKSHQAADESAMDEKNLKELVKGI